MQALKKYFLLLLLFTFVKINATHIVGGEMIYDDLGAGKYRITLKVYRDCFNGVPPFDGMSGGTQAILTVREAANGALVGTYNIGLPTIINIPPTINSPCIQTPGGVCVEEGIYTYTINLPPKTGGYHVIYQRCCRNNSILNLNVPGNQGGTYYAKIPGPEQFSYNSSPRYKNFPPIFICNNINFTFNHSALDPDGDQLVYSLCPPFLGADGCCPTINGGVTGSSFCSNPPPFCPSSAPAPPFPNVNYSTGYSGSYPIASSPAFSINPVTGILTGKPNLQGQFVVAICVQEFRNGVLIDTHYRDFQFNIIPCIVSVVSNFPDQIQPCQGNTVSFTNQSASNLGSMVFHWDFGVASINTDTSNVVNPTYVYQDTGKYIVTLIANPGTQCTDTTKKIVYVYPPLNVNFNSHLKQCIVNNSFSFAVQGTYINATTFNWNFNSAATPSTATTLSVNNVTYNAPGLYFVKLLAKQFACRDSFIDTIRVFGKTKVQINKDPICEGSTISFTNQSIANLGPLNFHWDFGVPLINSDTSNLANPIYTYADTGKFIVTLITNPKTLCADTTKKQILVYPPLNINFNSQAKQCFINNAFNFAASGIFANTTTFNWDFTSAASPSVANTLIVNNVSFNQPGLYFVQLSAKQFACRDSFIDTIRVLKRPKALINNLGNLKCDPAKIAFVNGSYSDLPLSYLWTFSNGNTSTAFEPTQIFTPAGIYGVTLTVKTTSICIDTSMFSVSNITVNPKPYAGFTFSPQVTTIFDPDIFIYNKASNDVVSWNYTFGDGSGTIYPSEMHTYLEYGDYVITQIVNNKYGCYDTLPQIVKILPEFRFWIPNCFTPDGNLLNDNFMPIAIGIINYEFDIFDRWGEKIFSTKNPKQGWNGNYKGKECKQEVYVWRITFKNIVTEKNEVHYGHVTLLKNL